MGDAAVDRLEALGFSEYEARAYVALGRSGPMNGYELAKTSKIPRANVYAVVAKLLERGAATRADLPEGTLYAAIAPAELSSRLRRRHEQLTGSLDAALQELGPAGDRRLVVNVEGRMPVLDQARALIASAESSILLAVWPNEAAELADSLTNAQARGVDITTLCLAACASECGGCRGTLYRYRVAQKSPARSLVVVADGAKTVTGQIGDDHALAVCTDQSLVVELATTFVRNAIALAALVHDLGARFDKLTSPHTKALLDALGPGRTDMILPVDSLLPAPDRTA